MLTTNEQDRLRRRLVSAAAAACLLVLAATPAAVAMGLQHSSVGSITIALTRHPKAVTSKTQAKFAWRTTGIVGETRCKLDGAAYTYCRGNPGIYGGLSDGHHTFTVRVRNGYKVTATASFSWLVDSVAPTDPSVSGGSASWRSAVTVPIKAAGSSDASSGLAGYQWRISTDGSAWSATTTGATATVKPQGISYVQFRSRDNAGNVSSWQPATNGIANMVRLDRTPPDLPTVLGGSAAWQGVASETVSSSGATDARSGVDHYEYRESADGGSSWSAAVAGSSDTVTSEGETLVQFRAVDAAGNAGSWAPSSPGPANTVRIDRSGPSDSVVTGGSAWRRSLASVTVTAGGSVDTGFGVDHYEYRVSTDGGASYGAGVTGSSIQFSTTGNYLVQFRAVDGIGLASAWAPASPGASNTACIS